MYTDLRSRHGPLLCRPVLGRGQTLQSACKHFCLQPSTAEWMQALCIQGQTLRSECERLLSWLWWAACGVPISDLIMHERRAKHCKPHSSVRERVNFDFNRGYQSTPISFLCPQARKFHCRWVYLWRRQSIYYTKRPVSTSEFHIAVAFQAL
jgi:hypothetical protein